MRKTFIIIFLALALISCNFPQVQIFNNSKPITDSPEGLKELDGSMYNTAIYFYDDKDRIVGTIDVGTIEPGGKSEKFKPALKSSYFKTEWRLIPNDHLFSGMSEDKMIGQDCTPIGNNLSVYEVNAKIKIRTTK